MKHIIFDHAEEFEIALLIKEQHLKKNQLEKYYISESSISDNKFIAFSLDYDGKKAPVKLIKPYLSKLLIALNNLNVKTLFVCDANYFKVLTGEKKAEVNIGYIKPCVIKDYEHMKVVMSASYANAMYNETVVDKIKLSLDTLENHVQGVHIDIGTNIIHSSRYPRTLKGIEQFLNHLHQYPELTCDIETFSLEHWLAGIGTIAFAWDKNNGGAFACDYHEYLEPIEIDGELHYGIQEANLEVRRLLLMFFLSYRGNLKFHRANFDIKIIIYVLWMKSITDHVGLIDGLEAMTEDFDCTKQIAYLALNSCSRPNLGLKGLAHEFAGNYAQEDITDIRLIPLPELLEYNLVDCLATWFVHEKYYPIMVQDLQEKLYLGLFKDSMVTILQMELTGMPMCMDRVNEVEDILSGISHEHHVNLFKYSELITATEVLQFKKWEKDFADRKGKAKFPENIKPKRIEDIEVAFNPNSGKQVAVLLYEVMGLPIIDKTDTGLPATGAKEIKKLINHTNNQDYKDIIEALRGISKVDKILTTFIPAFKNAQLGDDGIYYLFGNFNLGAVVSGRLSSSGPNLQNLPSGSTYGKLVKSCFKGNDEWVFSGADFASLEDYVSALTTGDPNKLRIYLDGYDGHSVRAHKYFGDQMPDIVNTVESINSIADKYPDLRKESKAPTFLLTYMGSYHGLMGNLGWSKKKALRIEKNYHELYKVSDQWVQDKLTQATKDGYITVAFGLRVRTPVLAKSVLNTSSTPYVASKEGRTAGNALGQSYGLLNNRAANEFMKRVRKSKYKYDIKLCALIHDAIYPLIRVDVDIIHWANKNLTECMAWQELPELKHDKVKLNAELDVFYPDWSKGITLKPNDTVEQIKERCA